MDTYPLDGLGYLDNLMNPSYNSSTFDSGNMGFSSTANPLINQLSVPLSQSYSHNVDVTPSIMDGLQSIMGGNGSLRDFGGLLGSKASSLGNNIQASKPYQLGQEFVDNNHNNLSEKNQFGNIWGGLQALNGLYSSIKQMRMADKQFDMQNDIWNKSWDANRKSVNEAVDFRAASRFNERPEERKKHVEKYSI